MSLVPPPPSDPTTPSEPGPGTPNSTTTSLSTLSVVAIKDGAVGHSHTHRATNQSQDTLQAERADRISRLAGLERLATVRQGSSGQMTQQGGSYTIDPQMKEISTVGSASATGSVGGKTTWASEMDHDADTDKMSEDHDEVSSTGGFSDEDKASLVGWGEGAGSTVSGPVSTANTRIWAAKNNLQRPPPIQSLSGASTPMSGVVNGNLEQDMYTADGLAEQTPIAGKFGGSGTELAENVLRGRIVDDTEVARKALGTPPDNRHLGKFAFEKD